MHDVLKLTGVPPSYGVTIEQLRPASMNISRQEHFIWTLSQESWEETLHLRWLWLMKHPLIHACLPHAFYVSSLICSPWTPKVTAERYKSCLNMNRDSWSFTSLLSYRLNCTTCLLENHDFRQLPSRRTKRDKRRCSTKLIWHTKTTKESWIWCWTPDVLVVKTED